VSPPITDSSMSETKPDTYSPDNNNTLDTSEDQQQTSPVNCPSQSRSNGTNHSSNTTADQLISRLVDYIRKQNMDNDIDFIANQVFK
jgi:hypothetical protein